MLRFGERNNKRKVLSCKKTVQIWDGKVDNIVIPKEVKKANSKYLTGCLDKAIRLFVLIMPKMSGYVNIFKVKDGDKDKKIN